ncbi:MAG TPA: ZIP family metal transporter [Verrucomicrobiae bacterium]|jgi:zinc transporter ZupT|nr:ZIP family metal transporter [Verrucomicrobiae bacterium]
MVYLYALIAGSSDFLSGWLALRVERDRIEPRYVIAFAAGVLLAVTFFEILPETNLKSDAGYLAFGFITFYVLEKLIMIHACGEAECHTHHIGPIAVLGMALDNVVDGAGIMVGYLMDPFLGLTITLAVVCHEIPQGMTSALIMRDAKWRLGGTVLALVLAGLLYPMGALLAGFIPADFQQKLLAFIAGDFIYLGAGDLLPEAHRQFNWKVVASVLGGMAFMLLIRFFIPEA